MIKKKRKIKVIESEEWQYILYVYDKKQPTMFYVDHIIT
jgi:hypothetical protein